ncbi:MAG: YcbK family protein [Woeseiaceae bacterium]
MAGLTIPLDQAFSVDERRLTFYHTHTQKTLEVTYAVGGGYIDAALDELNEFLSDFRTGDTTTIDPELLDLIYEVRESLGSNAAFEVISAYRSPRTNEMLRSNSSGVARNSQHLLGKAIDVRLRGVPTRTLRDAAIDLQRGGVGYYEQSDFVHMDTGRVRRW